MTLNSSVLFMEVTPDLIVEVGQKANHGYGQAKCELRIPQ